MVAIAGVEEERPGLSQWMGQSGNNPGSRKEKVGIDITRAVALNGLVWIRLDLSQGTDWTRLDLSRRPASAWSVSVGRRGSARRE